MYSLPLYIKKVLFLRPVYSVRILNTKPMLTKGMIILDRVFRFRCMPKRRYQMTKGIRSEKILPKGRVKGYAVGDKVLCTKKEKQIGFVKGKMSTGYFVLADIDGHTIEKCTSYKHLRLIEYQGTLCANSSPT